MTIKELGSAIDGLKGEIAEMQVQLKRAGEDTKHGTNSCTSSMASRRPRADEYNS